MPDLFPLNPPCDRPGCLGQNHGNHYHCGRCTSPKVTSMMGHYVGGEYTCRPEDLPPENPQPATPELDRMARVKDRTQPAGEFLDWLQHEQKMVLCLPDEHGDFYPIYSPIERLLALWQGIDLDKVEQEKRAILAWVREQQG